MTLQNAESRSRLSMAGHIIAAARSVFFRQGFESTSMDAIAQHAEVSKATLYAYFPGKDALFVAVMQTVLAEYEARLKRIADDRRGSCLDRLTKAADNLLEFLLDDQTLRMFRIIIAENSRLPELSKSALLAGRRYSHELVAGILREAVISGELGEHDCSVAAELFMTILKGGLVWDCLVNPRQPSITEIRDFAAGTARYVVGLFQIR